MKPRFIGRLNFAPQDHENSNLWQLEEAYGLVYMNLLVIVLPWEKTDGASIPWYLRWLLGKPFSKTNRHWSIFHDGGYGGYILVVDLNKTTMRPEHILECYDIFDESFFMSPAFLHRDWCDKMCRDGSMVAAGCPRWKRKMVYSGLKRFGWLAWARQHK